jgi:hypothetical protein
MRALDYFAPQRVAQKKPKKSARNAELRQDGVRETFAKKACDF